MAIVSVKSVDAFQTGPDWDRTIRSSSAALPASRCRSGQAGVAAQVSSRPYRSDGTGRRIRAIRIGCGAAIATTPRTCAGFITAVSKAVTPP